MTRWPLAINSPTRRKPSRVFLVTRKRIRNVGASLARVFDRLLGVVANLVRVLLFSPPLPVVRLLRIEVELALAKNPPDLRRGLRRHLALGDLLFEVRLRDQGPAQLEQPVNLLWPVPDLRRPSVDRPKPAKTYDRRCSMVASAIAAVVSAFTIARYARRAARSASGAGSTSRERRSASIFMANESLT